MYKESLKTYLDDLAAKKAAPGGGSAAALTAAAGVSLLSMVANFTVGNDKYKAVEDEIKLLLSQVDQLRDKLTNLVDEDVLAYKKIASAYKLPQQSAEDKTKRSQAIQQGLKQALGPPLEVCKCCHDAMKLSVALAEKGNVNLISDVGVAVAFLLAAFQSALLNVDINSQGIKDEQSIIEIRAVLQPLEQETVLIKEQVTQIVKTKMAG